MQATMTIEQFHALLSAQPDDNENPVVAAVRKIVTIREPDDIVTLVEEAGFIWTAWTSI